MILGNRNQKVGVWLAVMALIGWEFHFLPMQKATMYCVTN